MVLVFQRARRKLAPVIDWMSRSNLDFGFIAILVVFLLVLTYRLADPDGSLIFDESYYVQMARVIAGLPVTHANLPEVLHSGCDPNSEHPPLPKVIMSIGVLIFRDNGLGWRLPSVVLGVLGVVCVYGIALSIGATRRQARLATFVLAFDNLYFIHSRIATLDIYMVSFCLLGTFLYLRAQYEASGLAFGLATVCKVNGLLGVGALFLYELSTWFFNRSTARLTHSLRRLALLFVFWLLSSFFALGALDRYYTEFKGPLEHVRYIFSYGTSLAREVGVAPQGAESTPLQWWLNIKCFEYLGVWGTDLKGNQVPLASFQGCMNIYFVACAPLALGFCLLHARTSKWARLCFCLFVANYVPMLLVWIKARRISYLFYMLPSMPSISLAIACVSRELPPWVGRLLMVLTVYAFCMLFPFPLLR